jgi:hypothetical protein
VVTPAEVEVVTPKAIEPPKLASVTEIVPSPFADDEPPAPRKVLDRRAARNQLEDLLSVLATYDPDELAQVATKDEGLVICRFANAFTAMGPVTPKPKAVRPPKPDGKERPKVTPAASIPAPRKARNGDPVDPKDCKHPVNLRIGSMCSACGGSVK